MQIPGSALSPSSSLYSCKIKLAKQAPEELLHAHAQEIGMFLLADISDYLWQTLTKTAIIMLGAISVHVGLCCFSRK